MDDYEKISRLILILKKLPRVGNKTIQKILVSKQDLILGERDISIKLLKELNVSAVTYGLEKTPLRWEELQDQVTRILENAKSKDIVVLNPFMAEYPQRLLLNENFPPILFCRGNVKILNSSKIVGIVGTRNPTEVGENWERGVTDELVKKGYVTVSGLAIGSDTIGHLATIKGGGKTISLLPTPVDLPVYPRENQKLAMDILATGGALVSEYNPGVKLQGSRNLVANLVARDEWQAGLSDGLVVSETSLSGGTMHAIKAALKTNTPLAMLDYGSSFGTDPRFSGNVKLLGEEKAFPLRDAETLNQFVEEMDRYRLNSQQTKLKKIFNVKTQNTNEQLELL